MLNREKIIKELTCCIYSEEEYECPDDCPYADDDTSECQVNVMRDALSLLKEQQPKKPIYDCPLIRCPRCKNSIDMKQKYCDKCGQAVKWDE